jgi:hypothetical protein
MINKIIAWVWLVMSIYMVFFALVSPFEEMWFFVLVYYVGVTYIIIKHIESLK